MTPDTHYTSYTKHNQKLEGEKNWKKNPSGKQSVPKSKAFGTQLRSRYGPIHDGDFMTGVFETIHSKVV